MTTAIQRRPREEQPVARLRDEIETLFDRFLGRWQTPFDPGYGLDRLWGLDVEDGDNEIIVRAEIPGFEPEEIDVQIGGGALTIKAEKKQDGGESGNGGQTRAYRSFYRSMTLPATVGLKTDSVNAKYHSGVLEIHIHRNEETKPKHIPVQS
jgi:HSP20 family protein